VVQARLVVAAAVAAACVTGAASAFGGATRPVPTTLTPTGSLESAPTPVAASGSPAASTSGLSRDGLVRKLRNAMQSVGGRSGAWVKDTGASADGVLFSKSAGKRRIPASNEKLFTTAAALGRFGPTHRFETRVYARGKRTGTDGGVLDGDLVLVGDGDPAFGTQSFARRNGLPLTPISDLAQAVEKAGVRKVTGKVRADDTIFDRRRGVPATGFQADADLSPLSGLSFNSGFGANGYSSAPELGAARTLRRALGKRDVKVKKGVGRGKMSAKALDRSTPLGVATSPTLASLAEATNEPSNNFYAEMLLKRLGAGDSKQGTTKRGAKRVKRFARSVGTRVKASDGSGLGRRNRVSPKQVGKLLVALTRKKVEFGDAFRNSLAVAGREGTLANRMRGTAAEGVCEGKTGTLSNVSALSGYCQVGGAPIAFSILMNGIGSIDAAHRAQDRMVAAIARYER
jgi:serine-type D-Ala-D-Ala carboxypeptidase/endopeptidase (penicillin-binding protein 4)